VEGANLRFYRAVTWNDRGKLQSFIQDRQSPGGIGSMYLWNRKQLHHPLYHDVWYHHLKSEHNTESSPH